MESAIESVLEQQLESSSDLHATAVLVRSHETDTVIVTEIDTTAFVASTALKAFRRDFHTTTLADCTASCSEQCNLQLEALATYYGIVTMSDRITRVWQRNRQVGTSADRHGCVVRLDTWPVRANRRTTDQIAAPQIRRSHFT